MDTMTVEFVAFAGTAENVAVTVHKRRMCAVGLRALDVDNAVGADGGFQAGAIGRFLTAEFVRAHGLIP
jgi:hypothetical protein